MPVCSTGFHQIGDHTASNYHYNLSCINPGNPSHVKFPDHQGNLEPRLGGIPEPCIPNFVALACRLQASTLVASNAKCSEEGEEGVDGGVAVSGQMPESWAFFETSCGFACGSWAACRQTWEEVRLMW